MLSPSTLILSRCLCEGINRDSPPSFRGQSLVSIFDPKKLSG
jgi:hypothetical protein